MSVYLLFGGAVMQPGLRWVLENKPSPDKIKRWLDSIRVVPEDHLYDFLTHPESADVVVHRFGESHIVPLRMAVDQEVRQCAAILLWEPECWERLSYQQQYQAAKARCIYDLFWLVSDVLGYNHERPVEGSVDPDPILHGELAEELVFNPAQMRLWLAFRGSLKSVFATVGDTIRRLARNPNRRFAIISDTLAPAAALLGEIKQHFENNHRFQALWPERMPGKKDTWNQDAITIPREATYKEPVIQAVGADKNITGFHYDHLKIDDIVTKDNARTEDQRAKILEAFRMLRSIADSPDRTRWDIVGTRYHYQDLYGQLIESPEYATARSSGRLYIHVRQVYRDGHSAWPAKFSDEEIEQIRTEQREYVFSCQYLLDPIPERGEFLPEWIEGAYYLPSTGDPVEDANLGVAYTLRLEDVVDCAIFVDPAMGKRRGQGRRRDSDKTTILTAMMARNRHIYVWDYIYGLLNPTETVEAMIRAWLTCPLPVRTIGCESQAYQEALIHFLEKAAQERQVLLKAEAIHRGKQSKEVRIRGMIPWFERHMIHIRPNHRELERQLRAFSPEMQFEDDLLDPLADAVQYLRPRRRTSTRYDPTDYFILDPITGR